MVFLVILFTIRIIRIIVYWYFLILTIGLLDSVLISLGEILPWSLVGVKGLRLLGISHGPGKSAVANSPTALMKSLATEQRTNADLTP